jgi:hypothetical protein
LDGLWKEGYFDGPLHWRLAFREFGTSIGLQVRCVEDRIADVWTIIVLLTTSVPLALPGCQDSPADYLSPAGTARIRSWHDPGTILARSWHDPGRTTGVWRTGVHSEWQTAVMPGLF